MQEPGLRYTRNVKFAAFLRMKRHFPDAIEKMGRGRANYGYRETSIDDMVWADLKSEFDRSDFITYAQHLDAIIDLAF